MRREFPARIFANNSPTDFVEGREADLSSSRIANAMPRKHAEATERFFTGPLRWAELSPNLEARARALFYSCGQYLVPTFEQWEAGFCREQSPESEIRAWEAIDTAFRDYFAGREPTADVAAAVTYDLLAISLGMEKDEPLYKELRERYAGR
jgi:hypothetical protein